jgi:predicted MFS family arabinose efflux permease
VTDLVSGAPTPTEPTAGAPGGFAPLRHPAFRAMWGAQFASNIGGWMQTVGAQWLMLSLTPATSYLAFIQTAASLPVLLFAIPAGAVGDLVDRRRLLLGTTLFMAATTAALAALTIAGLVTPWALLAALFLVGVGQAWTSPTWQTLQPELVPASERPQAIALGSVNQNLARAIGPAIGGVLVALTEPSLVFLVNAATFLAVIAVVWRWRDLREGTADDLPPEHLGEAMRASGRYVANSPALRTVLVRTAAFIFFASAIWALLPVVARENLGLGSGAYGLLLACVGVGAVAGALLLPRLRGHLSGDLMLLVGSLATALTALAMATIHSVVPVAALLAVGGFGWILALATLNTAFQTMLPAWAKARGMAVYLVVFQGGNAIGSAAFGILAAGGLDRTVGIAAVGLALGPALALWRRMPVIEAAELAPASGWPPPPVLAAGEAPSGPVMVSLEYHAAPGQTAELMRALGQLRRARRRTGAVRWRAWQDAADPGLVLEQFVVGSWEEHERQHARLTERDRARLVLVESFSARGAAPSVRHWVASRSSSGIAPDPGDLSGGPGPPVT